MKTKKDYLEMQKNYYNSHNDEDAFKNKVVGNYEFQQSYPYEQWLLNINGDYNTPLFNDTKNLIALDFGCGMGRMVERMNKLFKQTDGVDIGDNLINYCKEKYPLSNFWITDGQSCGNAFKNHYDFVFSTICMQHIPSFDIRMNIWKSIKDCLNDNGKFCFQMLSFNDINKINEYRSFYKEKRGKLPMFSRWKENHYYAESTNSSHDVYIIDEDLNVVLDDANSIFKNVKIYKDNSSIFHNKLYICGEK